MCAFACVSVCVCVCVCVREWDSLVCSAPLRSVVWQLERSLKRWGWSCRCDFPVKQMKQYFLLYIIPHWWNPCTSTVGFLNGATGHRPRAQTQGTDPGHRPRAQTQGTDPGHRPRAQTQGTDPGLIRDKRIHCPHVCLKWLLILFWKVSHMTTNITSTNRCETTPERHKMTTHTHHPFMMCVLGI